MVRAMDHEEDAFDREAVAAQLKAAGLVITTVYRFPNNMVAVCDQHGQQMNAYQGHIDDVRDLILRDAPPTAVYNDWR